MLNSIPCIYESVLQPITDTHTLTHLLLIGAFCIFLTIKDYLATGMFLSMICSKILGLETPAKNEEIPCTTAK